MKLSQTISFDPVTLQPGKGLSIDNNEDNLGHFSQGTDSSDEEEDPEIDKVELMRTLMEKQMKLSEIEQNFAKKIESVKTSLKGGDVCNEFPEPIFKDQTIDAPPQVCESSGLFKKNEKSFPEAPVMVQSIDPRNYDSKRSKKSDNAFTIKFKEHMIKKGFASNSLANTQEEPNKISEIQESVHGSESQSEIDFDNVRSLNFFFEAKEVPKTNFYRSHEPQIFTTEGVHFLNNIQLAKQQKTINTSSPPINLFQKHGNSLPIHYQSVHRPPERTPQLLEPTKHPWTENPKMVASHSLSQMLESVEVGSNSEGKTHPFNQSIESDSFDYYEHAHPETHQASNNNSEEISESSQQYRRQKKYQNADFESQIQYDERDEEDSEHYRYGNVEQQEGEDQGTDEEVKYVCSDFHHYNQSYLKKHMPDYVHELIEDTNYKFTEDKVRHNTDANQLD